MMDFLFAGPAPWFSVPAAVGTIFFAIRLFFMLVGGDADAHTPDSPELAHDSDHAFKVLSVQSVAAFLMGFGWAGLGGYRGSNWGVAQSIGVGVLGGVAMVWFLAWLLKVVYDLQSSANISIRSLPGRDAEVYDTVPARDESSRSAGRIRVIIDNRERFYNAISLGPELPRGARVRIKEVSGDHTLVVTPIDRPAGPNDTKEHAQ